ncbi:kirola-like [Solanum stenotomum]|uniref:kirola-like n=1 Tax=Solanum stenotomum TaxID=172797 RepID=UPI0020D0502B|nr:kirola-like [Solanum stenotomum]
MSLKGKLVFEINIKCDGDVFYEVYRHRPHHTSSMSPDNIQNVDVHEDGKEMVAKEKVEEIDEEKKMMKKRIIEGDILEDYKSFYVTVHVETKGENNSVTWILEYEKKNANVPDPHTLMEFLLNVTKDIENHHIK